MRLIICAKSACAADAPLTTAVVKRGAEARCNRMMLARGTRVVIEGLVARPELNGRFAVVEHDFDPAAAQSRVPCRLLMSTGGALHLPGALLSIKPCNLKVASIVPDAEDAASTEVRDTLENAMGPDIADAVSKHLKCTRCLGSCEVNTRCRVEHPPHLQVDSGSCWGRDGCSQRFYCSACDSSYTIVSEAGDYTMKNKRFGEGPRWCFSGQHTLSAIPPEDKRRNYGGTVVKVEVDSEMQEKIDALPETNPDLATLVIGAGGLYDDSIKPTLCVKLPKLQELQLIDCAFDQITLNEELTPNLRCVQMQNVPDGCTLELGIPNLTRFSIHYFAGDPAPLQAMLDKATKLESFESYKLWAFRHIAFASNHLTDIKLHRSDSLSSIDLYAPRLLNLNLQACFGLELIRIRDAHPTLSGDLPDGFQPTRFLVSTVNANLEPRLVRYLKQHPRANFENDEDEDDGFGMGGGMMNPMEAMFRQMRRSMGGVSMGADDDDEDYDEDEEDEDDEWETEDEWETGDSEEVEDEDADDGGPGAPRIVEISEPEAQ